MSEDHTPPRPSNVIDELFSDAKRVDVFYPAPPLEDTKAIISRSRRIGACYALDYLDSTIRMCLLEEDGRLSRPTKFENAGDLLRYLLSVIREFRRSYENEER
jgi:hypothetical protein